MKRGFGILGLLLCCWGVSGQELKLRFPNCISGELCSMSFSQDSKHLIVSSKKGDVFIIDVNSGKVVRKIAYVGVNLKDAFFLEDKERVLLVSEDQRVYHHDFSSKNRWFTLFNSAHYRNRKSSIKSTKVSPRRHWVVTLYGNGTIQIWNSLNGRKHKIFHPLSKHGVVSVEVSNDDSTLAVLLSSGIVFYMDIASGRKVEKSIFTQGIKSAEFIGERKLLIQFIDGASVVDSFGCLLDTIESNTQLVNFISEIPNGEFLVFHSKEDGILLQTNLSHINRPQLTVPNTSINSIAYSSVDSGLWEVSFKLGKIRRFNKKSISRAQEFRFDAQRVSDLKIAPDGRICAIMNNDNTVGIWDVSSGRKVSIFQGQVMSISTMSESLANGLCECELENGDAKVVKLANSDLRYFESSVSVFDFVVKMSDRSDSSQLLTRGLLDELVIMESVRSFEISKTGDEAILYTSDSILLLLDSERSEIFRLKKVSDIPKSFYFSQNAKYLAIEYNSSKVEVLNCLTRDIEHTFEFTSPSLTVKFSADENFIAVFGEYGIVQNLELSDTSLYFKDLASELNYVEFSKDCRSIVISKNGSRWIDSRVGRKLKEKGRLSGIGICKTEVWDLLSQKMSYELLLPNFLNCCSDLARFSVYDSFLITSTIYGGMNLWNAKNGNHLRHFDFTHADSVVLLDFYRNDSFLITLSKDGIAAVRDVKSGEMLFKSVILNCEHIVHLDRAGHFDASPEAMKLMYWTKGLEVIEFEQLKDRYWVPGLVEKIMKGEELPGTRGLDELKLQPEVALSEIEGGVLLVTLSKREGGYGRVSVAINGKEIASDVRGSGFDTSAAQQQLMVNIKDHPFLQAGTNTITVSASSADGFIQGRGVDVVYHYEPKEELVPPHLYAVVIGVGQYNNPSINLKYPEADALGFSHALETGASALFGADRAHIYTLSTQGASKPDKTEIKNAFEQIGKQATSNDLLMVYLSGHGITWGGAQGEFYFLTADATALHPEAYNDPILRENHAISTAELTDWIKAIPALKQVMVIDACGSGKAVDNLLASRNVDAAQIKAIDRMKDRTGMFVISGCAADAVSYEASPYGQGLLTYALLQGMKGAALRDGQYLDVSQWLNHARDRVPQLAKGIGGIQEPQLLIPKSGSFDIGMLSGNLLDSIKISEPKPIYVRSQFQDAEALEDVLGLSKAFDEAVNAMTVKGYKSPVVYFDAGEYPGACRVSGLYTQKNGVIQLKYKIRCGEAVRQGQIEAEGPKQLVNRLMEVIVP